MRVNSLEAENFRNLERIFLEADERVNVIYGSNAQGKTNLIECVWMFTGARSFRGAKDQELIRLGSTRTRGKLSFYAQERDQEAELTIAEKRTAALNGIKLRSPSELSESFSAVIFAPVHLELIKGAPALRRRFIDAALCGLRPGYAAALSKYNRALKQRAALLKDIPYHSELYDMLDVWDDRLASFGAAVLHTRLSYIRGLSAICDAVYREISGGREEMAIAYECSCDVSGESRDSLKQSLLDALHRTRREDVSSGTTAAGPHRDDLNVTVSGLPARTYASQGQQRSAAFALKLGEAGIIRTVTGEQPVMLLDDVLSELDDTRQTYVLNRIEGSQVFITCCDPSGLMRLSGGSSFRMEGGQITVRRKI